MPHGATDFSNRYEEDIAAAAGMGCKLFRFSTAWARVEVSEGVFDEAALAHQTLLLSGILNTASSFWKINDRVGLLRDAAATLSASSELVGKLCGSKGQAGVMRVVKTG